MNPTTHQKIPNNSYVIFNRIGELENGQVIAFEKFSLNSYYKVKHPGGVTYLPEERIIAYTL